MMLPATVSAFQLKFHDMCNIASQMVGKWGRLPVEACNSVTTLLPAFSSRLLFLLSIFVLYILGLKEGYQNWALQAISPIVEDVMANGIEEDL